VRVSEPDFEDARSREILPMSTDPVFGLRVAGPNKFQAKTYLEMQTDLKKGDPVKVEDFHLDVKGLASCYSSTGGVGMPGMKTADLGKRAKGIPLWMIAVFILVGVSAFGFGIFKVTRMFSHTVVDVASPPVPKSVDPSLLPSVSSDSLISKLSPSHHSKPLVSYFVSMIRDRSGLVVVLSDGVVLRNDRIKSFTSDTVLDSDGVYHYRKPISTSVSSQFQDDDTQSQVFPKK